MPPLAARTLILPIKGRHKQLLLAVSLVLLTACNSRGGPSAEPAADLVSLLAQSALQGNARDRHTALYLLAGLEMDPPAIETVVEGCRRNEPFPAALFCSYFEYRRTQSPEAGRAFVRAFPTEEGPLADLFSETTDVTMPAELIVLLANLAADGDEALAKLLAARAAADGWVAEQLAAAVVDLERRNPSRVRTAPGFRP